MNVDDFNNFEALVNVDHERNELKCAAHLHNAAADLMGGTPVRISTQREDRNFFGSTDFIVAATMLDDRRSEANCAVIWELKAPQCFLFEQDDNKNRCRPTHDFVKAENQLLHYAHLAMNDANFRQRFDVMDTRNIRIGGIIIGRSRDKLLREGNSREQIRQATLALSIRESFLYQSHGIRVLTWDRILDFVRP
jgi:hypothetical protein